MTSCMRTLVSWAGARSRERPKRHMCNDRKMKRLRKNISINSDANSSVRHSKVTFYASHSLYDSFPDFLVHLKSYSASD